MKICPRCKFHNQEKQSRCFRCGWVLEKDPHLHDLPIHRGYSLFGGLERFLRLMLLKAKSLVTSELPSDVPYRFRYVAAALGLFFGLGQIYNRQYKKAVLFCLAQMACLIIVFATITNAWSNWIIFLFISLSLYGYNDGLVTAVRINGQNWIPRYSVASWFALLFIVGFGFILGQFLFMGFFRFIRISQDSLAPTLRKRDLIFVDCMGYWLGDPRVGEIVFYTPEPFYIEIPGSLESTVYSMREKRTFERVMGLPGDVVERRDGQFFRNGSPMPSWCIPLVPDNIPGQLRFVVPEDRYLVIYSHSPSDAFETFLWGSLG
ncbi:MAG TPA: signal peptidase I, partial [Candidatus Sumerlaeota bacterium]|nr:signal peptidase I [Candidatus Sumerlaeota bacterium]